MNIRHLKLAGFISLLLFGCDSGITGNFNENIPPTTNLTVNEINLSEDERLTSQINISWWGDDPDGYVVGFEFFIGEGYTNADAIWSFTTRNDSTFVLPIKEGELDDDVRFTIRAVDNDGAVDPNPPSLVFPIRNSPPEIRIIASETPPDTTYRVFSFGLEASDADGFANLNRIEIALNDTTSAGSWIQLEPDVTLITMRIDDTIANPTATISVGRSLISTGEMFTSINLNAENTMYFRSVDNAAAISEVKEFTWYVKQQTSKVLFLNDYFGPNSATREQLHLQALSAAGITQIDYFNISDGTATGGRRVALTSAFPNRSLGAPTINKMLAEWDHIYWISDNLDRNIGYALELTIDFFSNGGTMFINIPTKVLFDDNPLLEFLPFERVQPVPQGQQSFIIQNNSIVTLAADAPNEVTVNPPHLQFRRNLLGAFPIVPFGNSINLFEAPFRVRSVTGVISNFDGPKLISTTNSEKSVLFFGIDLSEFTADSELGRLIELTCLEILGFEQ
jgi:hypothetical protein